MQKQESKHYKVGFHGLPNKKDIQKLKQRKKKNFKMGECSGGEIGKLTALKMLRSLALRVQVPPRVQKNADGNIEECNASSSAG